MSNKMIHLSINSKNLYYLFCLFCFCIFSFVSINNFISHSEFWSIQSGQALGSFFSANAHLYYKPLFYFILKLVYFFDLENINHILASRFLFGTLAFLCLQIYLNEILRITKDYSTTLLFGVFLLSFQIYFYNIFRVRADLLASFFILLSFQQVNISFNNTNDKPNRNIKFLLFLFLAFLSTPKSIYLIIALLIYNFQVHGQSKDILYRIKTSLFSVLLFFSFALLTFSLCHYFHVFPENPYALALYYHVLSLKQSIALDPWSHILTSFKINFLHYILILFGVSILFKKKTYRYHPLYKSMLTLSFICAFILMIHPEKWTYFIAQYIPFISLPFLFVLLELKKLRLKVVLASLLIATPFLVTNHHSWFRSNKTQFMAIHFLQDIFDQIPNARYFDSTGLLPKRKNLPLFLGPNEPITRLYLIENLKNTKPEFIFFTTKMQLARPEITTYLYSNYKEVKNDIWIRFDLVDKIHIPKNSLSFSLQSLFIFDYQPFMKY